MKLSLGLPISQGPAPRAAILFAIFFCVMFPAASKLPPKQSPPASSQTLRIGEILNYRIDWRRFTGAATAQLQIVDRGEFFGAASWHFRAALHTAAPIRAFYPVDDEVDSYAIPIGLETREYKEHFREFGQPEDTAAALVASGQVSTSPLPRVIVPAGTRDALSVIYLLRSANWNAVAELRTPVFDGQNIYSMIATRKKTEPVQIAAGDFKATKISIRLLDETREIPDEHFTIWLANDSAQTPVLCEAHLSIGTLRVELVSDSAWSAPPNTKATLPANQ